MKPLGRKYFKSNNAKHHCKINGVKHNWWGDVCSPSKTRDKQQSKLYIKFEIESVNSITRI